MIVSGGTLKSTDVTLWKGHPRDWPRSLELSGGWSSYSEIYRTQLWVNTVVNKLSSAEARLPLKVYERDELNRPEARDHPYARLLANPNRRLDPVFFWIWTKSTQNIYGEAFWLKERDRGGRPVQLHPVHPTKVQDPEERNGRLTWTIRPKDGVDVEVDQSDIVVFRYYHPDNFHRGLSPLEPLRRTLENEDAARRATSAFWKNAGRPSVALSHPNRISNEAAQRIKSDWERIHGGVDNFAKAVILEEGMKPEKLSLTAEEAQYIESRKLNREEVCAEYDVPPPVVHILDRATFSNITEQMRSMYRDTMAPRIRADEAILEHQLRRSVRKGATEPDFGDDVYAEFLMDEVLRGDFEQRQEAYAKADYMTIAEKRRAENLPFIDGTDRIVINAASIPLDALDQVTQARMLSVDDMRTVMGRLSRPDSLDDVDADHLVDGLNGSGQLVRKALADLRDANGTVEQLRERIKELTG